MYDHWPLNRVDVLKLATGWIKIFFLRVPLFLCQTIVPVSLLLASLAR